jgi:hypothetical protein
MEVGGLLSSRGYDLWVCACDVGEAMTSLKHHWVLDMMSYGPETMFLSLVGNMDLRTWYGIFRMWTAILMFLST